MGPLSAVLLNSTYEGNRLVAVSFDRFISFLILCTVFSLIFITMDP